MRKIKVGLIQQSNTADIRMNLMNLAKSIEACAAHGAQLIVLQELHNSLYFCQTENTNLFDLAEPIPGPSTGFYSELAAANRVVLVTSLFEKRAPGLYHNTAVVFDRDGSIAGKYRKMHIPDDPAYYEKFYFTPGDIGFEPIIRIHFCHAEMKDTVPLLRPDDLLRQQPSVRLLRQLLQTEQVSPLALAAQRHVPCRLV